MRERERAVRLRKFAQLQLTLKQEQRAFGSAMISTDLSTNQIIRVPEIKDQRARGSFNSHCDRNTLLFQQTGHGCLPARNRWFCNQGEGQIKQPSSLLWANKGKQQLLHPLGKPMVHRHKQNNTIAIALSPRHSGEPRA